jgi:hypothetical protein
VARDDRTPASKQLGWGLDSPSGDWLGWLGGIRFRRRSAAREAAIGRGGRNAGELVVRPANARAQEGPRGAGDAKAELGLERRWWMVGCTGELGAAATAGAEERCSAATKQMRGRRSAWGVGRA